MFRLTLAIIGTTSVVQCPEVEVRVAGLPDFLRSSGHMLIKQA
jgi:hypothetical protein